jgi:hypothetical protein
MATGSSKIYVSPCHERGRRGRDRMVVGLTTAYVISAYHHWCYEIESRSGQCAQHYVIKFVSDLGEVDGFLGLKVALRTIKQTNINQTYVVCLLFLLTTHIENYTVTVDVNCNI